MTDITTSINRSQHCQRNWDLTKTISADDVATLVHSVTQCPSKQNYAYYRVHVITDRNTIESIYDTTTGFRITSTNQVYKNTQTLANVLFAFEATTPSNTRYQHSNQDENNNADTINKDLLTSLGIATGYLNLTASLLGYYTGYCQCFDSDTVSEILNTSSIELLLGVGYNNPDINNRQHHLLSDIVFPGFTKETIEVIYV